MLIVLLCSILIAAAGASYATRRSIPRLPGVAAVPLVAGALALAIAILATRMSMFTSVLSVLVLWMIGLPLVATWRAVAAQRGVGDHG